MEQFCRGKSEFSLNPGDFHCFRFRVYDLSKIIFKEHFEDFKKKTSLKNWKSKFLNISLKARTLQLFLTSRFRRFTELGLNNSYVRTKEGGKYSLLLLREKECLRNPYVRAVQSKTTDIINFNSSFTARVRGEKPSVCNFLS